MASSLTPNDACAYEAFNSTTGCFTPRSCAECLCKPGCMVGRSGQCQSVTNASAQASYQRAMELNLTLPAMKDSTDDDTVLRRFQDWEFPTGNATYCPTNDSVCKQCINEQFWFTVLRLPIDNRFCVGTAGCVCVASCELKTGDPICQDGWKAGGVMLPGVDILPPLPTMQECRYLSKNTTTGCLTYRSCKDCMKKRGCRIGIDGHCEADDASASNTRFDYHKAVNASLVLPTARTLNASGLLGTQEWQFSASDFDYCPSNDTVCSECIRQHYWQSPGAGDDSRFCVGASGCICVANCMRDDFATYCPTPPPSHDETESSGEAITRALTTIAIVGLVLVLVVIGLCGFCCYSASKSRRTRNTNNVPVARVVCDETIESATTTAMYVVVRPADSPRAQI